MKGWKLLYLFPLLQLITVEIVEKQSQEQVKHHKVAHDQGWNENRQTWSRVTLQKIEYRYNGKYVDKVKLGRARSPCVNTDS